MKRETQEKFLFERKLHNRINGTCIIYAFSSLKENEYELLNRNVTKKKINFISNSTSTPINYFKPSNRRYEGVRLFPVTRFPFLLLLLKRAKFK